MAAGREQSSGRGGGAGYGASIRWVSTIARACWTRKFVWQVACGKSIERGGTKANAFRMLSSLNRQFRVQHCPPCPPLHLSSLYLPSGYLLLPQPLHLSAFLPAYPAVQPRANLLGTLFVAAAVDPNLQCFLSGPGHVGSISIQLQLQLHLLLLFLLLLLLLQLRFELVRGSRHFLILSARHICRGTGHSIGSSIGSC